MRTVDLNGTWQLRAEAFTCQGEAGLRKVRKNRGGWMKARVPGEVHLDLIRAGKMPEPLVGDNIASCRWPETKSWWYRTWFAAPGSLLAHERLLLIFDGLDLHAQVFLNGKQIGSAANAFVPAVFEVGEFLKKGRNELVVRMTAGAELARDTARPGTRVDPKEDLCGIKAGKLPNPAGKELYVHRDWPGRKWLRKPQFQYGWDWIDPLANIGIFRGVRLEGRGHVVLDDLRLDTVIQKKRVFLEGEAVVENLHPWSDRACTLEVRISPPKGKAIVRRWELDVQPGRLPVRCRIEIPDPQLWWPNGMGGQPLYHVTAEVRDGKRVCDRREFDVGLRTVEIDRPRVKGGNRFCIKVNGEEVFCKGANWGPADAICARVTPAKYRALVEEAREANFNMFRVNGTAMVDGPAFFDACDRAGILIWQDFMFSCSTYPDSDPHFTAAARSETETLVRQLRHHPSIALWCGNNENNWGFPRWWNKDGGRRYVGGSHLYNRVMPDIVLALDPNRPYWPSSPSGGDDPNDELSGDSHLWDDAYMSKDPDRRFRHEIYDGYRTRFASEYGAIAPCHPASIRQYLRPDERDAGHRSWQLHTNTHEKGAVSDAIRMHYADPENLGIPEWVLYGQMVQGALLGGALDAMRFRKLDKQYDCQGALSWSYSDCWGETGWSIIDYYLRRKAAFYWCRRASAPVKTIVRRRGRKLITRVVNDTLDPVEMRIHYGWLRFDGTDRRVRTRTVRVAANGMSEVAADAIPPRSATDPAKWFYAAWSQRDGLDDDTSVWLPLPVRQLDLPKPEIRVVAAGRTVTLVSDVFCHGVHVDDGGRGIVSDNYFDLLPGMPRTIAVAKGKTPAKLRWRAIVVR